MKEKWNTLIKRQMKPSGFTIIKIAERLGVSKSTIGHWLNGERNPNLKDITKMFHLVGIDSVTLHSDGLVSLKEVRTPAKIEGIEVRGSLLFDQKGQVGTFTPANKKQFIDFRSNDPDAYAIQIRGQGLMPRVKNTEYLIIEPCKTIQLYDDVLIKLKNEDEFLIKTFVAKPDDKYDLYAFNDINTGLASNDSESYNKENIVIMEYVAAIVSKHRLMK